MILSDLAITRPVLASVVSLLLVIFGLVSFSHLPLRQFPDIDPPVISVETRYPGAAAPVVESRVTLPLEERIAGIPGVRSIEASSEDGRSRISIEFNPERNTDGAANDVRERVAGVLDELPEGADPPEVQKADSDNEVFLWFHLASDRLSIPELSDYARRHLVERFAALDGVARVRIGGEQLYAMRIWLDRQALTARGLTVAEVESVLRAENLELPAGAIESRDRVFSVRIDHRLQTPEDFAALGLARAPDGHLIRLGEVARIERGTIEDRALFRGNGKPMVGIGMIKQAKANTIAVARAAKSEMARLAATLPEGMSLSQSFDSSVFVEEAANEVYRTLGITLILVVLVIFVFLGNWRLTLIPALAIPVSLIASFIALWTLNLSINLLTLLALVLAIGLVVDDAIVVLENIHRRMLEEGEPPLIAAWRGTRQVGFAVIATTLVLIAVFAPIAFLEGDLGRLFGEFALTLAAAVAFSSWVALTLAPMLASKVMHPLPRSSEVASCRQTDAISLPPTQNLERSAPLSGGRGSLAAGLDRIFDRLRQSYRSLLTWLLAHPWLLPLALLGTLVLSLWLFEQLPREYAPREDRGAFSILINAPEGASYAYTQTYMDEIERRLMPYVERGEVRRLLIRSPRAFSTTANFNTGMVTLVLAPYAERRSAWIIMDEMRVRLADLPGVRVVPVMRQGFGSRTAKPVQFVIAGDRYEELAAWRDSLLAAIDKDNPGLTGIDWDYKETRPRLVVRVDAERAADLGVRLETIGRTLETLLGGRRIGTYLDQGEEYDVILAGERDQQRTPASIDAIQVRSVRTSALIPLASLVQVSEVAESPTLNRLNRSRAITIEATLKPGVALGTALADLEAKARSLLPERARIDYKGQSRDFKQSSQGMQWTFALGILVVYLVLAAQFESFIQPLVIMLSVPLAMAGALIGLWAGGQTLNLFTQIGLLMLVGLAAKNGILIVEFANQLRDQGLAFRSALIEASVIRLRPVLMTGITTVAGAIPLFLASGAGAEVRQALGLVILSGGLAATLFTLIVVPAAYDRLAQRTGSPGMIRRQLDSLGCG
ncbi:efflux RND transporter permease subunit [Caldichromatium japonicum]|uniref:Efflux RND transporter permease subunit n=1 Tax=Caldichromatium japonicum TaxID=2699430 RepID=A0A6G7VAL0_9GAMM|nr:efflux RND transporter permease subunit [Caldichromatium japonicum]QIK37051.1 efflux RND transporter permease subunit [Caldichromatium japonicum]